MTTQELATGAHVVTAARVVRVEKSRTLQTSWSWCRGWNWLPAIVKPVNVMRGDPVVMPLALCQLIRPGRQVMFSRLKNA